MVNSLSDEYIDPKEIYLWLKLKITKQDGTLYVAGNAEKYSPVDYLLNSMWSQVDVTLGDTLISQSNNTHPWKSQMEARFCISGTSKFHFMKASGYYRDVESAPDSPHKTRYKLCAESKDFTLYGRIHSDIFFQDKLIINGVPLKIKLIRASDAFCLLGDGLLPKLNLKDAVLFVRKVRLNPSILAAHAKILSEKNAKYPIVRTETKAISLAANQHVHFIDNVFLGRLPRKIIFGILSNEAHLGSYAKSPFNFQNHTINFVQVYTNSEAHPQRPFQPDFSNNIFAREYFSLYENVDQNHGGYHPLDIDYSEYAINSCLFAFDFNPDKNAGCGLGSYINIPKMGTLRIEIHFKTAPTAPLKLIVYGEFDSTIEINKNREVLTDY